MQLTSDFPSHSRSVGKVRLCSSQGLHRRSALVHDRPREDSQHTHHDLLSSLHIVTCCVPCTSQSPNICRRHSGIVFLRAIYLAPPCLVSSSRGLSKPSPRVLCWDWTKYDPLRSNTTGISIDFKVDTWTIELHSHITSVLSIFSPNEDVNSGTLLPDADTQAGGKAIPKTRHSVDAVHISAHAGTPTARFAKQASVPKKTYWS